MPHMSREYIIVLKHLTLKIRGCPSATNSKKKAEKILGLLKHIPNLFKPKSELSRIYAKSVLGKESRSLSQYTKKDFLFEQDVYAYRLQFATSLEDSKTVIALIASSFNIPNLENFQEGTARNKIGESIHYAVRKEFNGAVVELVTNSLHFLNSLDALDVKPMAPWVAFPDVEPLSLGSLQGDIDYWWTWYWLPFWRQSNSTERLYYLTKNQPSNDWREFIEFHAE